MPRLHICIIIIRFIWNIWSRQGPLISWLSRYQPWSADQLIIKSLIWWRKKKKMLLCESIDCIKKELFWKFCWKLFLENCCWKLLLEIVAGNCCWKMLLENCCWKLLLEIVAGNCFWKIAAGNCASNLPCLRSLSISHCLVNRSSYLFLFLVQLFSN